MSTHRHIVDEHQGSGTVMLGLATLGFALNFWAWALLSPARSLVHRGPAT